MPDTYDILTNCTDASFNPADCHDYGISLVFSEKELICCIADLKKGKYIGFQHFAIQDSAASQRGKEGSGLNDFFGELIHHQKYLKENFKVFRMAYMAVRSTLIPSPLYEPSSHDAYLKLQFGAEKDLRLLADHIETLDAHQVFAVPLNVYSVIEHHFERKRIFCYTSALIQSIWVNHSRLHATKVFLNLRSDFFDVMVFNGKRMDLFNTFSWTVNDDIIYFLIFVMEQLSLNPEEVPVVVMGETDDGPLSELLYTYVRHVEFARQPGLFKYSHVLREIPAHAHYVPFNFLTCGL